MKLAVQVPHASAGPSTLAAARAWVFGIWAIKLLIDPLPLLAKLPPVLLAPLGPLMTLPDGAWDVVLTPAFLVTFKVVLLVACVCAAAGVYPRPAAIVAALGLFLYQALVTGFSNFVDHTDLSLLLAAFILAASPIGDAWTWIGRGTQREDHGAYRAPLVGIVAMLSATYLLAGVNRLTYGIPSAFDPAWLAVRTIINGYAEPSESWGVAEAVGGQAWWGLALLFGTLGATLMELASPLNVLSRRFRVVFICVMIPFHTLTDPLFNVRFWSPIFLYVFLIDCSVWAALFERAQTRLRYRREVSP